MLLTEPSSQSSFVHLFNHSFISFWTMNIYCIFLDCEPVLLTRISLEAVVWAPVSLMLPSLLFMLLLLSPVMVLHICHLHFLSQLSNQSLLPGTSVSFVDKCTRNEDLGLGCMCDHWNVTVLRFSLLKRQGDYLSTVSHT